MHLLVYFVLQYDSYPSTVNSWVIDVGNKAMFRIDNISRSGSLYFNCF